MLYDSRAPIYLMNPLKTAASLVVAGRFEVEALVRVGQMGKLFRAHDRETGQSVALKLLRLSRANAAAGEHFEEELRHQARLAHPGLATIVAHGQVAPGEFFLATAWLEGEDLAQRMVRQPLGLGESLTLGRVVAAVLASLHEQGRIHGDLKPSRLFLRGGAVEDVVLLGAGLPRGNLSTRTMTQSDEILASLHYAAPELLRGEPAGPGADVFALGCILFECLTGSSPFAGTDTGGLLGQVLSGEVATLGQVRPELPAALGALFDRVLSRETQERMAHGQELGAALAAIELLPHQAEMIPAALAPIPIAGREQRLVSLILALPLPAASEGEVEPALAAAARDTRLAVGEQLRKDLGLHVDVLADGSLVATLVAADGMRQTAVDQAVQAARVAERLQARCPTCQVAAVMGRSLGIRGYSGGEAFRRAATLLADEEASPGTVWLDELMAELLDTRFLVHQTQPGRWALGGARRGADEIRPLLGRSTPCVGREQELRLLVSMVVNSIEEPRAQASLILAPSGTGKSRLRQEFVRRLEAEQIPVKVAVGRCDALHAGTAYGLFGQIVLELCNVAPTGAEEERGARLAERIRERLPGGTEGAERVVQFLGELCGLPLVDDTSPQLRAARQDPRLMSDQIAAATLALLRAECAAGPVLLVLEDLHWCDEASMQLVEAVLRQVGELPLVVLGLARPEFKERFPRLLQGAPVQEIRLGTLGRKASEQLVWTMLGPGASSKTVARIVEQAGGHALFLEELIRAVAEGATELPETVLAMLQARLLRLDERTRRALAVASVFGERFWRGGVVALLYGEGAGDKDVERSLQQLVAAETIVRQMESRWAGEVEYVFRHILVREAAYGLLGEEDRRAGHRAAAEFLERVGEREPVVLAEHFRRGGEPMRAAHLFARAALASMEGSDLGGALCCVEQGLECRPTGEVLGTLQAIGAWSHIWGWNFQVGYELACAALPLLTPGSEAWCRAIGGVIGIACLLGHSKEAMPHARTLAETMPAPGTEGTFLEQLFLVTVTVAQMRFGREPQALLARAREIGAALDRSDVRARGMAHLTESLYFLMEGDAWLYGREAELALACFMAVEDRRYQIIAAAIPGWRRRSLEMWRPRCRSYGRRSGCAARSAR